MTAGVVFAHGAFHGPWCWERVQGFLNNQDIVTHASDLCRSDTTEDIAALQSDVNDMVAQLGGQGPVMAVGHSLGGMSISGLDPNTVDHLVYLSAVMPTDNSGEEPTPPDIATAVITENFFPALARDENGLSYVKPGVAAELFYHDCTAEDATWAESHLRPQPLGGAPLEYPRATWRDVDTTYIVCADDRVLAPDYQRACGTMTNHCVELAGSHSPMLAQPDAVAQAIIAALSGHA